MKGSLSKAVLAALAVLLVLFAFLPLTGMLAERHSDVPVLRAEKGSFELRVPAQGNLQSVQATPVSVPSGVPGPFAD